MVSDVKSHRNSKGGEGGVAVFKIRNRGVVDNVGLKELALARWSGRCSTPVETRPKRS